ncbi:MAG TPA: methyltransferase domain-containing protein, partial [Enteractinococcus sp.]
MGQEDPAQTWNQRYQESERMWSGKVNTGLESMVSSLEPGTALDLGCGEGADVVWLAEQGWYATGVDISSGAIER